jgi:hypothetical protein
MADDSTAADQPGRKDSFAKGLSKAVLRKAVVPVAASAATAGTAYLTRKSSDLWQAKVLPKVRERGGGRAVAKEALEKVSGKIGGRGSGVLSALAERIGSGNAPHPHAAEPQTRETPGDRREEEREERRRRRQQRQRALDQSGSS